MYIKLLKLFSPNKVEVLIYKSEDSNTQKNSLDSYSVIESRKSWRRFNYKAQDGSQMVHTSTVFSFSPTLRYLKLKGVLIGNCYTNPKYRGQSIYSKMLQYIEQRQRILNKEKEIFIFVHPKNAASISGIEKAGFKKIIHFKSNKWLCFFYNEEIIKF